jgi:hypothetical protein
MSSASTLGRDARLELVKAADAVGVQHRRVLCSEVQDQARAEGLCVLGVSLPLLQEGAVVGKLPCDLDGRGAVYPERNAERERAVIALGLDAGAQHGAIYAEAAGAVASTR